MTSLLDAYLRHSSGAAPDVAACDALSAHHDAVFATPAPAVRPRRLFGMAVSESVLHAPRSPPLDTFTGLYATLDALVNQHDCAATAPPPPAAAVTADSSWRHAPASPRQAYNSSTSYGAFTAAAPPAAVPPPAAPRGIFRAMREAQRYQQAEINHGAPPPSQASSSARGPPAGRGGGLYGPAGQLHRLSAALEARGERQLLLRALQRAGGGSRASAAAALGSDIDVFYESRDGDSSLWRHSQGAAADTAKRHAAAQPKAAPCTAPGPRDQACLPKPHQLRPLGKWPTSSQQQLLVVREAQSCPPAVPMRLAGPPAAAGAGASLMHPAPGTCQRLRSLVAGEPLPVSTAEARSRQRCSSPTAPVSEASRVVNASINELRQLQQRLREERQPQQQQALAVQPKASAAQPLQLQPPGAAHASACRCLLPQSSGWRQPQQQSAGQGCTSRVWKLPPVADAASSLAARSTPWLGSHTCGAISRSLSVPRLRAAHAGGFGSRSISAPKSVSPARLEAGGRSCSPVRSQPRATLRQLAGSPPRTRLANSWSAGAAARYTPAGVTAGVAAAAATPGTGVRDENRAMRSPAHSPAGSPSRGGAAVHHQLRAVGGTGAGAAGLRSRAAAGAAAPSARVKASSPTTERILAYARQRQHTLSVSTACSVLHLGGVREQASAAFAGFRTAWIGGMQGSMLRAAMMPAPQAFYHACTTRG